MHDQELGQRFDAASFPASDLVFALRAHVLVVAVQQVALQQRGVDFDQLSFKVQVSLQRRGQALVELSSCS